ncbi:MAG: sulfite exporter TauE/SafE family protein [Clostridia bacterium]|nr:sulfite exporter TauE/SafE family protein [Clostridia bacterium]
MTIILTGIIILFSAMVQGATSFGFSLLALPLLGLFLNLKTIVPMLVFFSLIMNIIILMRLKMVPQIKSLLLMFVMAVLTTPIGVLLLKFTNEDTLKIFIGIVLILIAIAMKRGFKIHMKNQNKSYFIAGILSGLLNGSVSLSGPPIVVMLSNENKNRDYFRSSLTTYFLLLNIVTVFLYAGSGLITFQTFKDQLIVLPFLIIGTLVGTALGSRINEEKFKAIVLNLLVIMGIINLL